MNGLAPKHLMPEESILWDAMQVADWEIAEALRFAPGTHPLDQASMYMPYALYEWQADTIAAACLSHSNVALSTANESGKTSSLIPVLGLGIMAAFPGAQVCSTSGDERQVKEQLFEQQLKPMMKKDHMKKAGWTIKTGDSMKVTAPNGSTWLGYVSQRDSTFEGFHSYWREDDATGEKRYCPLVFIVDESKSVSDGVDEAIGRIDPDFRLNVSTPGVESGWFYEAIGPDTLREATTEDSASFVWNRYKDPYGVNPLHSYVSEWEDTNSTEMFTYRRMVSWEDCPHLHTEKKRIARLKKIKKFGIKSAYVKSMLFGQFQRSEEFNLIYTDEDIELMKAAMRGDNHKSIGNDVEAAGDISGGGDEQGLMLRIGTDVVLQDHHQQDPADGAVKAAPELDQADYWVSLLTELKIKPWQLTLDGGGLGATVANYMETRKNFSGIKRAQANMGPRFKSEYRDKYTESHFLIKELLSAGVLKIKYDKILIDQMRSRRFIEMESGGKLKTEAKPAHRKREKSSPDRLDTLVYLFYDFDRSLLDTHVEITKLSPDADAPTEMEKKAEEGGGVIGGSRAFGKMRGHFSAGRSLASDPRVQKLRIGRR